MKGAFMNDISALRAELVTMKEALEAGRSVEVTDELRAACSCFSAEELKDNASVKPSDLDVILAQLCSDDIPTLDAAIAAIDTDKQAWLGFKIVTDAGAALCNEDTAVMSFVLDKRGASADDKPLMFFANEQHEIVSPRVYSQRDAFQMLDITRGPHMHDEQYAGVAWVSQPLIRAERVFVMGAGSVGVEVASLAHHVGFQTVAVDYDPAYLTEDRFPDSERILIDTFNDLSDLRIGARDYVLVLTRGHMYDPEVLIQAIEAQAYYIGMMGSGPKNEQVYHMAQKAGITQEQLDSVFAPIGIKCGGKSPEELAVSIVAELIQQRAALRPVCHN
jgi:xanthine dehydrogenase accessory factor